MQDLITAYDGEGSTRIIPVSNKFPKEGLVIFGYLEEVTGCRNGKRDKLDTDDQGKSDEKLVHGWDCNLAGDKNIMKIHKMMNGH